MRVTQPSKDLELEDPKPLHRLGRFTQRCIFAGMSPAANFPHPFSAWNAAQEPHLIPTMEAPSIEKPVLEIHCGDSTA